jgi:hypothetical protein
VAGERVEKGLLAVVKKQISADFTVRGKAGSFSLFFCFNPS